MTDETETKSRKKPGFLIALPKLLRWHVNSLVIPWFRHHGSWGHSGSYEPRGLHLQFIILHPIHSFYERDPDFSKLWQLILCMLIFIINFLGTRCWAKSFMCIISQLVFRTALWVFTIPIYRWRNWSLEKFSKLLSIT